MVIFGERLKIEKFDRFDPEMTVRTRRGVLPLVTRVASFWAGGLNIELIEPVSGYVDH